MSVPLGCAECGCADANPGPWHATGCPRFKSGMPRIFKGRPKKPPKEMDPRKRLQQAQRFFARLLSFDMECPRCGTVYCVRVNAGDKSWDPSIARFTCTTKACGRTYVLGILAWPVGPAPRAASATPRDQVPNARQLGQMRKEGGGWWMAEDQTINKTVPEETNQTTEDDRPEEDPPEPEAPEEGDEEP